MIDHSIIKEAIRTISCVLFYYCFSIGITFYNKWMFSKFHFPISTTMIHFTMTFLIAGMLREIISKVKKREAVMLNWNDFLKKVMPTGIISALDIGLSNWSFMFITVSLYTMVKSSCILFILFFSLVLGLEKPRWNLVVIVSCISFGLFLFVFKSTQFNLEGFILVLLASFLGGARWTLSQVLCQKAELGLTNPIDTVYHLCPTMIIGLFPIFIGRETSFLVSEATFNAQTTPELLTSISLICMGGLLAFFLSFSEYLLLSYTSSLTLAIAGIFKELCTLILATTVGSDELTLTNWLGFLICILGISTHVYNKYQKMNESQNNNLHCSLVNDTKSSIDMSSPIRGNRNNNRNTNGEERSGLLDNQEEDAFQDSKNTEEEIEYFNRSREFETSGLIDSDQDMEPIDLN